MRCSTSKESEIVPIRRCGKISVSLSSREFVTPKRESLENAEREWCAKQHDIMVNRLGLCDDDLNSNERDLPWLLRKGHEFLTKENYLGAVSAYSFGLKISKDLPDLFLGRARAQYALRNYERCVRIYTKIIVDSSDISYLFYNSFVAFDRLKIVLMLLKD